MSLANLFSREEEIHAALINGLAEMKRQHIDHVVLTLHETEPSENARGRWLTVGKDTNYYPFGFLPKNEQEMILNGKHYERVALVTRDVGGFIEYRGDGVEVYHRTHITPFLPKLLPECLLNYVTEGGAWTEEDNVRKFAKVATSLGWTKESIEKSVAAGMQDYHNKTKKLMQNAGVYAALEKMEQKRYSPFQQIMAEMRQQINQARK